MRTKIMTWNVEGGFSYGQRGVAIVSLVEKIRPSVAIFPQAYSETEQVSVAASVSRFQRLGYNVIKTSYDDSEARGIKQGILGIVEEEKTASFPEVIRLGTRNALHLSVKNQRRSS